MVPSLTSYNPPWSPHPPLTTPHGPLTRLGQPPLVPSHILNQLIKNDLDLFLLDTAAVAAVALIYIRIDSPLTFLSEIPTLHISLLHSLYRSLKAGSIYTALCWWILS